MFSWLILFLFGTESVSAIVYIDEDVTYRLRNSPITITEDTIVKKHHTLTIEPGVEVRLAAGVLIGFNGTLDAQVSTY